MNFSFFFDELPQEGTEGEEQTRMMGEGKLK